MDATQFLLYYGSGAAPAAFAPTDIAGLQLWIDFSDATTLYTDAGSTLVSGDGDLIYQANDKSLNGRNLTQATEGNRPSYKVSIQNGLSIGRYLSQDSLSIASQNLVTGWGISNAFTVFLVKNARTIRFSGNQIYSWTSGATNTFLLWNNYFADNKTYMDCGDGTGTGRISAVNEMSAGTWYITTGIRNVTVGKVWRNTTAVIDGTGYTDALDSATATFELGYIANPGNDWDCAEIIVYNSGLLDEDRLNVWTYLNAKWSVY